MDAPTPGWYFSTMGRRSRPGRWTPPAVEFHRTKYGRELLVDAAFVRAMPSFLRVPNPHVLRFHDILLVTRGRGTFRLDDERCRVAPGVLLFTRPGELRAWDVRDLDGACLFFSEEFVAEAFADVRFLDQLAFFREGRPSAALGLYGRRAAGVPGALPVDAAGDRDAARRRVARAARGSLRAAGPAQPLVHEAPRGRAGGATERHRRALPEARRSRPRASPPRRRLRLRARREPRPSERALPRGASAAARAASCGIGSRSRRSGSWPTAICRRSRWRSGSGSTIRPTSRASSDARSACRRRRFARVRRAVRHFRLSVLRPNSDQLPSFAFTLSVTSSAPVSSRR